MVYYLSQSDDLCIYFVNDNGDYSPSSWTRKFHVPEACCDVSVCFNSLYFKTLFSEVAAGYKAIVCVIDIVVCVCVCGLANSTNGDKMSPQTWQYPNSLSNSLYIIQSDVFFFYYYYFICLCQNAGFL